MEHECSKHDASIDRRSFLKHSTTGAAGLAIASQQRLLATATGQTETPIVVNPDIDNLRVVFCRETDMVTSSGAASYAAQCAGTDTNLVASNMDTMAKALAQKDTAAGAWQTIFQKPSSKSWSDVKVAVKVNTQGPQNVPRYAVVVKICQALVDHCGVTGSNICLYDSSYISHTQNQTGVSGTYGSQNSSYPFPSGVQFNSNLFSGGKSTVAVTASGAAVSPVNCLADLVDGTVDILISVASNKGHYQAGQVTLTQKNHIGSLKFFCPGKTRSSNPTGYTSGSAEDLVALNLSDAIMGGTPVRQQLCIVDSLWASSALHPVTAPDSVPGVLVMGVHAGAVDYLTTKKVREDIMGVNPSYSNYTSDQNHFITGYGYSDTERSNLTSLDPGDNSGKGWVDAASWEASSLIERSQEARGVSGQRTARIVLGGSGTQACAVEFKVPSSEQFVEGKVLSARGRLAWTLDISSLNAQNATTLQIGASANGRSLPAGNYVVRLKGKSGTYSKAVSIL